MINHALSLLLRGAAVPGVPITPTATGAQLAASLVVLHDIVLGQNRAAEAYRWASLLHFSLGYGDSPLADDSIDLSQIRPLDQVVDLILSYVDGGDTGARAALFSASGRTAAIDAADAAYLSGETRLDRALAVVLALALRLEG